MGSHYITAHNPPGHIERVLSVQTHVGRAAAVTVITFVHAIYPTSSVQPDLNAGTCQDTAWVWLCRAMGSLATVGGYKECSVPGTCVMGVMIGEAARRTC